MNENIKKPDFLFEVSWEVCNKIGGIHTVIATKALSMNKQFNDNYLCIGPDVWKETHGNPEFVEDKFLFRSWRKQAEKEGLHFRIGRWQIPGEPITILVDFTPLFGEKDKIFTDFWLKFGLNSLSGQWDYTEPAMFGYAVGQVIESFYDYHLSSKDRFVAHFHEWMTGTGVLYLKDKVPQAGTVFASHATTIGRSLAAHGKPLYAGMDQFDAQAEAHEMNIVSKFSLEQVAAKNADSFITVSPGSAIECEKLLGIKPNVVAPNGFDNSFVPDSEAFSEKRINARKQLVKVAQGLFNQEIPENATLIALSGRYEYRNKGMDLFIDALDKLNKKKIRQEVVAFILVPANQTGIRAEVSKRICNPGFNNPLTNEYVTHKLADNGNDPVVNHLSRTGLNKKVTDKVKVVFVPAYLNGNDGAINLNYYDALIGFDITVFPSYYEPWGYTPLESAAFHIPTVTTSLTGFAQWVKQEFSDHDAAIKVLERHDGNDGEVVEALTGVLENWCTEKGAGSMAPAEKNTNALAQENLLKGRELAGLIASKSSWEHLIHNYFDAFSIAIDKVNGREELFKAKKQPAKAVEMPPSETMRPKWKKIFIRIKVPETLSRLPALAKNLWWTWNYEAQEMFESIDPGLWEECEKNPNKLLEALTLENYQRLEKDPEFMQKYRQVVDSFDAYMGEARNKPSKKIAYFSMEYGLHQSIKIYSGGLGVLAGDYLKQASDQNINMVAIGLLYRYGYFSQNLTPGGEQLATYHSHNFTDMSAVPVRNENGERIKVTIAFPGRNVHAKVWKIDVGRVPLYLLDTDIPDNSSIDRFITHQLYGGDWENRFKQEFLLGVGGIRVFDALGIQPDIFHLNEGHAAFTALERLRKYVQDEKLSFNEAMESVRASSLFTTHTPVPAGHDFFSEDMLRTYMPHYADRLGISWEKFMSLGKMNPKNPEEAYSMSVLASKLAYYINGVSRIHGRVSQNMFKDLYPGYFPEELHIGYVTNGVHYGTWTAKEWQQLYAESFGKDFLHNISDAEKWQKIYEVDDSRIWDIRNQQRKELLEYMKKRLLSNLARRQETPRKIYQILEAIDENTLTIGFARRFATYKRAHLLFNDLERLSKIVNKTDMPLQIIYAGKAHPADKAGQELIKHILEVSKRKEFRGKVIFLEDYDMDLGAALVKGVDIWLNTPTRPMEASGTSGQKAVLNGVMNFSVLDGWWAEGYAPETGWAIKEEKTYENQEFQNELDAETIYNTLENEIIPMFYNRDSQNIPTEWIRWIKNCIARVAPHFTNKRMVDDYMHQFYGKLFESSEKIQRDDYEKAHEIAVWKNQVLRGWDSIEVTSKKLLNSTEKSFLLGESFKAEIVINLNELSQEDFGVEVVFIQKSFEGEKEVIAVYEMEKIKTDDNLVTYRCDIATKRTGIYNYAFRMFPKHPDLPHRQDFNIIKWL